LINRPNPISKISFNPDTRNLLETIKYHRQRMINDAIRGFMKPKLYFITETFNDLPRKESSNQVTSSYSYHEPKELLQITHDRHADFYKHILNQTVPSNHYPSRKKFYPVAMSFIDLAGSKHHRSSFLKMPHVHSLFIVPARTEEKFELLIEDQFRRGDLPKTKHVQTVSCQNVDWRDPDVTNLLSYSSKFYRSDYAKSLPDDIRSLLFTMHG
jgi:hypothetical protein